MHFAHGALCSARERPFGICASFGFSREQTREKVELLCG
jgi:hypothetical protein